MDKICPCGSSKKYNVCCGPLISGVKNAPTAEALMRSRYTAYVVGEIGYVEKTHDPKSVHTFDREAAESWAKSAEWLGLEVLSTEAGQPDDETGVVEFIARFRVQGSEMNHREISVFRKDGDRWFYTDGKTVNVPLKRSAPKLGRNDPCSCGSGKKFKKCCAGSELGSGN